MLVTYLPNCLRKHDTPKIDNKPRTNWIYGKRPGNEMANERRICTWNVRTLLQLGSRQHLLDVLNQFGAGITALQEMRWKGYGILSDRKRRGDIYYSGAMKQGMYGVGFVVSGYLRNSVISWIPVNERICVLRTSHLHYMCLCANK